MTVRAPSAMLLALSVGMFWSAPAQGQWMEPPGVGWLDLTVYHQDTRTWYDPRGEVREILGEGHVENVSVFLTATFGIVPGVDAWLQAPFHRLRFTDTRRTLRSSGVGDALVHLRIAPLRPLGWDLPLAVRGGAKVPMTEFEVDPSVIPLGDGQTDWELLLELGHSFYPVPAYVSGWIGHRWRSPNPELRRDFANEAFFLVQAGGQWSRLGTDLVVEGMRSVEDPIFEGIPLSTTRRAILELSPGVSIRVGGGTLGTGVRVPVLGRNLPAGPSWILGYFTRWSLVGEG